MIGLAMYSGPTAAIDTSIDKAASAFYQSPQRIAFAAKAQVAELVDALVSGTSAVRRGGSSPLLGTTL